MKIKPKKIIKSVKPAGKTIGGNKIKGIKIQFQYKSLAELFKKLFQKSS